jgi:hypothetical protein
VHARTLYAYIIIWFGVFWFIEPHQSVRLSENALRNNKFYWYMYLRPSVSRVLRPSGCCVENVHSFVAEVSGDVSIPSSRVKMHNKKWEP